MKLSKIKNIRFNKTWLTLGIALVVGVTAAMIARSYLNGQAAAIEARGKAGLVPVVVAKTDLHKGEKITTENVAIRQIPAEYAQSSAVRPNDFGRIDGQKLDYPLARGEMVMWSLMEGKKVPTFSARLEPGHRAITVPVDEINSISGMLEPGDIIDLIVSAQINDKKLVAPVLQATQVIATGSRSVDDPKSGERKQYSTVTLDTTPGQARDVIMARDAGKITALLRNPQDTQVLAAQVDLETLLNKKGGTGKGTGDADGTPTIPIMYGGGTGKFPPESFTLGKRVMVAASSDAAGVPVVKGGNAAQAAAPPLPYAPSLPPNVKPGDPAARFFPGSAQSN